MISDWLKAQKKPTRTNQIRTVSIAPHWRKFSDNMRGKMAGVFSKQRFGFVRETTIEELIGFFFQKPKYSKEYVFLAECMGDVVQTEKHCQQN